MSLFDELKKAAGMGSLGSIGPDKDAAGQTGPITRAKEPPSRRWHGELFGSAPQTSQAQPAAAAEVGPVFAERGDHAVMLESFNNAKIQSIKVVREHTGLGLKDAKELVEGAPCVVVRGVGESQAKALAGDLLAAGATASVTGAGGGMVAVPSVGTPVAEPRGGGFCPHCGKPLTTDGSFCPYCGNRLRAAAPVATPASAVPGTGAGVGGSGALSCDVVLEGFDPPKKIQVIKVVRELTGLGLKDAKDLVENVPRVVVGGVDDTRATDAARRLGQVGAVVRLVRRG